MTKSKGIRLFVKRGTLEERFWSKVDKKSDDECWNWLASTHRKGYGQINLGDRGKGMISSHRLSWIIHYGEIPNDMHVLHKCDNPKCVNPKHLFLGTNIDNVRDMKQKGRTRKGENHWNSKLTEKDVMEIKTSYIPWNRNYSLSALAKRFGVDVGTIHAIVIGRNWKWVK